MDPDTVTRCLTHIQAHLDGDLSLKALSAVAGCSPPYFARQFAAKLEETPKHYISRLRLERAALRLILLDDSILDIALDSGFSSHESFCRAFRCRFGVAPRIYRKEGRLLAGDEQDLPQRVDAAAPVSLSNTVVRTLHPMSLAFLRHTGPYELVPIGLWDTLIDWAHRHRIPTPHILMGIAHDAPGITPPNKLRFDAAIRVPHEFRTRGRVGHMPFTGGLYALTTSVGPLASIPTAYQAIMRRVRRDRLLNCLGVPCLEFYRVNRVATNLSIVSTEIAIPVRRRR